MQGLRLLRRREVPAAAGQGHTAVPDHQEAPSEKPMKLELNKDKTLAEGFPTYDIKLNQDVIASVQINPTNDGISVFRLERLGETKLTKSMLRDILQTIEDKARSEGIDKITIVARESDRLIYEKSGYVLNSPEGTDLPYYTKRLKASGENH